MVKVSFLASDLERWVSANLVWSEVERVVPNSSSLVALRTTLAESLSPVVRRDIAEGEGNRLAEGYIKYRLVKAIADAWKEKPNKAVRLEIRFSQEGGIGSGVSVSFLWVCEK